MKVINLSEVAIAFNRAYFLDMLKYCRREIFPQAEDDRKNGYADSINKLAEKTAQLSAEESETIRLHAYGELETFREKIYSLVHDSGDLAMAHDLSIKADILIAAIAIVMMLVNNSVLWILMPIGCLALIKLLRALLSWDIDRKIHQTFYNYGWNEAIVALTDKHGLTAKDILSPLRF